MIRDIHVYDGQTVIIEPLNFLLRNHFMQVVTLHGSFTCETGVRRVASHNYDAFCHLSEVGSTVIFT